MKNDEATKVFETYLITGHVPYPYELREASKAAITALNSYKQMLEEAVEGEVVKDITNKLVVTVKNVNLDKFKFGDKVRLIVIKENEI